MKVLMITPSFLPIVGGTERLVQSLALKLNQIGIHTDVMTFNMNAKWKPVWREEVKGDNFKVFRVPGLNAFYKWKYNPLEISFGVHVVPKIDFAKQFKDYDVLHFHDDVDLSFPLFSCFIRRPKIFQCHTLVGTYKQYKISFFSRAILKKVANSYICVSNIAEKLLLDLGVPKHKISILHNGVDAEEFKPNKEKKIDNLILYAGRVIKDKGLHVLLNSLKYLDIPVSLKVIGPKEDREYIKGILGSEDKQKRGIHEVELLGPVNQDRIVEWYQKASILVTPSLKEEFGIVNLEALSCETPVVASDVGGIAEIVKHDVNGILVPPNDSEKLASAIKKLLENKELRDKFGRNGRIMVKERFSWDSIIKELITIYEKTFEMKKEIIESSA